MRPFQVDIPGAQRVEPGTETVCRICGEWKPKVRGLSTNHSAEVFWRNSDDHDGNSIEGRTLTKHRLICCKMLLEVAVAQDHRPLRLFSLVISIEEEPAGRWRQPQHAEKIVGNKLEFDAACRPGCFLQNSNAKPRARKYRGFPERSLPETPVSGKRKKPLLVKRRLHCVQ